MKDLKCGLKECKYNKGYSCCSKNIQVAGNTDCLTFTEKENDRKSMFEAASDFPHANFTVDTEVKCNANCLFNKNNHCISNGITVMGQGEEAACLTFIKE